MALNEYEFNGKAIDALLTSAEADLNRLVGARQAEQRTRIIFQQGFSIVFLTLAYYYWKNNSISGFWDISLFIVCASLQFSNLLMSFIALSGAKSPPSLTSSYMEWLEELKGLNPEEQAFNIKKDLLKQYDRIIKYEIENAELRGEFLTIMKWFSIVSILAFGILL